MPTHQNAHPYINMRKGRSSKTSWAIIFFGIGNYWAIRSFFSASSIFMELTTVITNIYTALVKMCTVYSCCISSQSIQNTKQIYSFADPREVLVKSQRFKEAVEWFLEDLGEGSKYVFLQSSLYLSLLLPSFHIVDLFQHLHNLMQLFWEGYICCSIVFQILYFLTIECFIVEQWFYIIFWT